MLRKNVSKNILIPFFEMVFEEFKLLLKLIHFITFRGREVVPESDDHLFKIWMTEPEKFKSKMPFTGLTKARPLQENGPMI